MEDERREFEGLTIAELGALAAEIGYDLTSEDALGDQAKEGTPYLGEILAWGETWQLKLWGHLHTDPPGIHVTAVDVCDLDAMEALNVACWDTWDGRDWRGSEDHAGKFIINGWWD